METATTEYFTQADLISSYSRAQAIEDGVLVDISNNEVASQHYKYPIAVTAAVWEIIHTAISNRKCLNDLNGVIHDILFMSKCNSRKLSESARLFEVIIRGAGRKSKFLMKIICGAGDDLLPVLTILNANED